MSYPGSKGQAGVWQRIIGNMPPHSLYVEPFAGSAHIFLRKKFALSVLIDSNAGVVASLGDAIRATHGNPDTMACKGSVTIFHGSAMQLLPRMLLPRDALIYCDPPYMLHTRTKKHLYGDHEMTDEDHATLLSVLVDVKCYVMISGYPSELYSSRLRGWRCFSYRTRTRGRTVTECLWCNFPEPTVIHDWRYAGRNHRQRHKWGLVGKRWLAKLAAMPALKRGYVLNSIERRHDVTPDTGLRSATPQLATAATNADSGVNRSV